MSQRKAEIEAQLEILENWLGRGARSKKLLEILTVKIDNQIHNPVVRQTSLEDIAELRKIVSEGQQALNWIRQEMKL